MNRVHQIDTQKVYRVFTPSIVYLMNSYFFLCNNIIDEMIMKLNQINTIRKFGEIDNSV